MKVEVHLKTHSTFLQVPLSRNIQWLIEATQLWAQEAKGVSPRLGKCQAKRSGGEVLDPLMVIGQVLREGESVYIFLPEDLQFISLGR